MKINYDDSGRISEIKFEEGEDQKSFYENLEKIMQNLSSKVETIIDNLKDFENKLIPAAQQIVSSKNNTDLFKNQKYPPIDLDKLNPQQLQFLQAQQQAIYDMYIRAFDGDKNNLFVKNGLFGMVNPVPGSMIAGGFGMDGTNRMFEPSLASLNRKVSIFELMYKIYPEVKDTMKVPLDTIEMSMSHQADFNKAIELLLNDGSKALTVDEAKANIEFKKHVSKSFVYIIKAIDAALGHTSPFSYYNLLCEALGEEKINAIIKDKDE